LLEQRRELLAIALLDPAALVELGRISAELDEGTLGVDAVVDEPQLSELQARARFEELRAHVRALHEQGVSEALLETSPAAGRRDEVEREPAYESALRASAEVAHSLQLDWLIVDRLLKSGWVQSSRQRRRRPDAALPPTLALRVAAAQKHVEASIERFVTEHRTLVHRVAHHYRGLGLSREDLIQDGNIGLLRAIEKFDARRGRPFAAYAVWWIRHAIRSAIAARARTIRLPASALARSFAVNRAAHRLARELGREPSQEELSSATGVAAECIADVLGMPKEPISLDAARSAENEHTLGDILSDPLALDADDALWASQLAAELHALFELLSPRERYVLSLRFGLDGKNEHTLQQIGQALGLTRERIRQIAAVAMKKLEQAIGERELQP
jgi:RNA polymerase primary sigma factor